jgi:hypothetical protein
MYNISHKDFTQEGILVVYVCDETKKGALCIRLVLILKSINIILSVNLSEQFVGNIVQVRRPKL